MKKEFIKFLKSKRLWSKFQKEFKSNRCEEYDNIDEYFKDQIYCEVDYVASAFEWNDDIWGKVDTQWIDHLNKIKN